MKKFDIGFSIAGFILAFGALALAITAFQFGYVLPGITLALNAVTFSVLAGTAAFRVRSGAWD